jgi:hypothetical protein
MSAKLLVCPGRQIINLPGAPRCLGQVLLLTGRDWKHPRHTSVSIASNLVEIRTRDIPTSSFENKPTPCCLLDIPNYFQTMLEKGVETSKQQSKAYGVYVQNNRNKCKHRKSNTEKCWQTSTYIQRWLTKIVQPPKSTDVIISSYLFPSSKLWNKQLHLAFTAANLSGTIHNPYWLRIGPSSGPPRPQ